MVFVDYLVLILYFSFVIALAIWYRRQASRNLESYFLGGKRMHWSLLSMSGAVSNFDITGTMWMVSVVFLVGMKSWWHFQMAGFMLPAFGLAYMAKWVRRANVLTGAEWMITRFGAGRSGRVARYSYATLAVVTCTSFIGYAFQGIGKFARVYLPLEGMADYLPVSRETLVAHEGNILALLIFAVTALYIVLGGLFGVVITDAIQTLVLGLAALLISYTAYATVSPAVLESRLPEDFQSLMPVWRMDQFAGTENWIYEFFGAMVIVWLLKGFLLNAGGPAQLYDLQRFLAARNPRDAAKVAAAWPLFGTVRFMMVMAIALLALSDFTDVRDPELVMPRVLEEYLPAGLRGLVIAGLLAAFMSTFSSTVNSGASYIVRDIWQPVFRPVADERHLVRYSYISSVGVVVVGVAIGFQAESISQIWGWIMMALGAGVIIPNVLRWYWWRLNGWGYAAGVFGGIAVSLIILFLPEKTPAYKTFPVLCAVSTVASIAVSLLTSPVEPRVLKRFYETVRPFGLWGPVKKNAAPITSRAERLSESPWLTALNTVVAVIVVSGLFIFPCYLVGHWYSQSLMWAAAAVVGMIVLYFTWYRNLPPSTSDHFN